MPHTFTATAHAMPLPNGRFLPLVRTLRVQGARSLGQTLKPGLHTHSTAADALQVAQAFADGIRQRMAP